MKEAEQKIRFNYLYADFRFSNRRKLKTFLFKILQTEGKEVEDINYIFCNDAYLLQLNKQYLNHDTLTDIITFELSPKGRPLLSDIFISIERVKENTKLYKTTFEKELLRVIIHGALHLAGYKDKTQEQKKQMRGKEEEYILQFNVSRNTVSG